MADEEKDYEVHASITVTVEVPVRAKSPEEAARIVKHEMARQDVLAHAGSESFDLDCVYVKTGEKTFESCELDEDKIDKEA